MPSTPPGKPEREPNGSPAGSKRRNRSIAGAEAAEDRGARPRPAPGLYLVATPIGNLGDISSRALDVLAGVDLIACEDSRVTGKLLAAYGIATPMTAYHDHNAEAARPRLIAALAAGERVALVSDAGTPLVSDPGYKLVRAATQAGMAVTAIPGPSATLTALALSGLPTDRFLCAGFLPTKPAQRRKALAELATVPATLVLFETAPRLASSLADMAAELGPREAAVCRELTKLYEEVRRGSLAALAAHYQQAGPPKGEIVVVVGPPPPAEPVADDALDRFLAAALTAASLSDAVAQIAAETGLPRKRVYARALALAKDRGT